jgi:hypothetical protein
MHYRTVCWLFPFLLLSCFPKPGSLKKLEGQGIKTESKDFTQTLQNNTGKTVDITYLGCGGLMLNKDGDAVLIDPFFSNKKSGKIGKSVFLGTEGREIFRTDKKMLKAGVDAIERENGDSLTVYAILNAHSHYDHLMDIPAVFNHFKRKPLLLLTETGLNIVHKTIDTSRVVLLENFRSTSLHASPPIVIARAHGEIHVYPILAAHNPHFRNIKFFSGQHVDRVPDLDSAFDKSRANLWLEGNTFSFLIDYLNEKKEIELRVFVQSSSCPAPAGIPPKEMLGREVDIAFIGVVSYKFSPGYPCGQLSQLSPRQVLWVHWEDFFRRYTRKPKTVRGTDLVSFFEIPCVHPYKSSGKFLWPRARMKLVY